MILDVEIAAILKAGEGGRPNHPYATQQNICFYEIDGQPFNGAFI